MEFSSLRWRMPETENRNPTARHSAHALALGICSWVEDYAIRRIHFEFKTPASGVPPLSISIAVTLASPTILSPRVSGVQTMTTANPDTRPLQTARVPM
eukprot:1463905-Pyramimonas_sp.AAC.1